MSDAAWKQILSPLSVNLGRTWREWQRAWGHRARRLSRRGVSPQSLAQVFAFSLAEAGGEPDAAAAGMLRLSATGAPPSPSALVALDGDGIAAQTQTRADGSFAVEGLEAGGTYILELAGHDIVGDDSQQAEVSGGTALLSLPPEFFSEEGAGDLWRGARQVPQLR